MLIDPTVVAKTVVVNLEPHSTLQLRGTLAADESIPIEIPDGAGGWNQLTEDDVDIALSPGNMQYTSYGKTIIRVNKPITDNAVGVAKIG